jgi:hypothetical protein
MYYRFVLFDENVSFPLAVTGLQKVAKFAQILAILNNTFKLNFVQKTRRINYIMHRQSPSFKGQKAIYIDRD